MSQKQHLISIVIRMAEKNILEHQIKNKPGSLKTDKDKE
jgi:hypothetical protein